jgi:hypothetical protein
MTGNFRSSPVRISAGAILLLGLLGGTSVIPALAADGKAMDIGIKAFKDICLASAPSFAGGTRLAKKYGVETWLPLGKEKMGMTKDDSLSVQIQPGKECAITTKTRPGTAVHTQFMKVVTGATKHAAIGKKTSNPFVATAGGKKFIFKHDRSGGEAYVMLSKD